MDTEPRHELPLPHFEDRLSEQLAELHRQRRVAAAGPAGLADPAATRKARRRRSRRGRTGLILGAAALAGAAATVAVSLGTTPSPSRESRPDAVAADPQAVMEGVLAATEPTDDAIVHATTTRADGSTETWYDELTVADRMRHLNPEGEPLLDSGWPEPPAVDEPPHPALSGEPVTDFGQCDPGTGLSMDEEGNLHSCDPGSVPSQPFHPYRVVNHCEQHYVDTSAPLIRHPGWGYLRMYLETGDIVVDGTEQLDGRELIRLRNHDSSYVYLVDPESYFPVQETVTTEGSAPRVTTYERLPRTAENLALLSPPVPEGFEPATTIADCGGVSVHDGPGGGS